MGNISLRRLTDEPIADVIGYISREFGEPVFKITKIELDDGTVFNVNGEHDIAYIESNAVLDSKLDDDTIDPDEFDEDV